MCLQSLDGGRGRAAGVNYTCGRDSNFPYPKRVSDKQTKRNDFFSNLSSKNCLSLRDANTW